MRKFLALLSAGLALALANTAQAADATFDFESLSGDGSVFTPFIDTNNGVTALFVSDGDPAGFLVVGPSLTTGSHAFQSLTGNFLADPGPANLDDLQLAILFDHPLSSISMNFALNAFDTDPENLFALEAFQGLSTSVGATSTSGVTPLGFDFPEGTLSFSSATPFDIVLLSSPALDFAIDNIAVTLAPVPEPGALALLCGAGFAGLAACRHRRRK